MARKTTTLENVETINSGAEKEIILGILLPALVPPSNVFWINEHVLIAAKDAAKLATETETAPNRGDSLLATVILSGLKTAVWEKANSVGKVTAPTAADPRSSPPPREPRNSVFSTIIRTQVRFR